jgi:hypothetical protein
MGLNLIHKGEAVMNGKKLLLATILLCGWSVIAPAQGLVGAPVDPRYGQCNSVDNCPPNPAASRTQPMSTMLLNTVIMVLRIVRL